MRRSICWRMRKKASLPPIGGKRGHGAGGFFVHCDCDQDDRSFAESWSMSFVEPCTDQSAYLTLRLRVCSSVQEITKNDEGED